MIGILIVVGAFLVVLATSLFKTVTMSAKVKNIIAVVLSAIVAVGVALWENGWSFEGFSEQNPVLLIAALYGTSQAVYNFILKNTAIDAKLEDTLVTDKPAEAPAEVEGN